MDASVLAASITSAVAVVVAVGGAVRSEVERASDRRYERWRTFLIEAQDSALALRSALRAYGAALKEQAAAGEGTRTIGRYRMSVPDPLELATDEADGRFDVCRSRVESAPVLAALDRWRAVARVGLIDVTDLDAGTEERAFATVNAAIGAELRTGAPPRGRSRRRA